MVIFVAYGKGEGEKVGVKVNEYFKKKGYDSFLASPDSPDVKSGESFQKYRIDPNLQNAHVFVPMITPRMSLSEEVMKEIRYAKRKKIPIVPYVRGSTKPPSLLKGMWTPVSFPKSKGGHTRYLLKLEFSLLRRLEAKHGWTSGKPKSVREFARVKSKPLQRALIRKKVSKSFSKQKPVLRRKYSFKSKTAKRRMSMRRGGRR